MSVNVSVYGADKTSDEYESALKLKDIIIHTLPDVVTGEIVLFASATLYGQAVKDVDLLMLGKLDHYDVPMVFRPYSSVDMPSAEVKGIVDIRTFCTVIEIKRHDISGIERNGTDIYVKYSKGTHCVTTQSNRQKISAKSFFESTLSFSPYITNVIWFTQVLPSELRGLLGGESGTITSNVIGSEFQFKDLMNLLVQQRPPIKAGNRYIFDSNYGECSVNDFQKALALFSETKRQMGELTRKRIEMITNKSIQNDLKILPQGKISVCRGRAGTGKTVGLIQNAIRLVDDKDARVLILTYNRALVSDIRRLFALAELPDMFDEHCVYVNTMQSYFYALTNAVLYDGKMSGEKFLNHYNTILKEMNDFLADETSVDMAREICSVDERLNWEYVFIDEAQDWSPAERDIIIKLFDNGKVVVADGGNQFVRKGEACDWTTIQNRNSIKLKYCLRQKENIVSFINSFTTEMGMLAGKVLTNGKMLGGKVIVTSSEKVNDIMDKELFCLLQSGNIAYDMLCLVPHSLVKKTYGDSKFVMSEDWRSRGISFWDGTNSEFRERYSIRPEEVRVLQYDSARGLEGWTVICMDFDEFLKEKAAEYNEDQVDSLLLESPEERKKKYIYNWAMIPLTRAIDTLIISVKNVESEVAQVIKRVIRQHSDYVEWI